MVTRPLKYCFNPGFLALLLALGITIGCSSAPDKPAAKAALAPCGWLPNCVNSVSGRGLQAVEPIKSNDAQWQQMKIWIARQPDWEIVVNDSYFIQAVVKTPVMRFRDDVQLHYDPDIELIQVRSSSRLGISDIGTNYRRIEALRAVLYPATAGGLKSSANSRSNLHD